MVSSIRWDAWEHLMFVYERPAEQVLKVFVLGRIYAGNARTAAPRRGPLFVVLHRERKRLCSIYCTTRPPERERDRDGVLPRCTSGLRGSHCYTCHRFPQFVEEGLLVSYVPFRGPGVSGAKRREARNNDDRDARLVSVSAKIRNVAFRVSCIPEGLKTLSTKTISQCHRKKKNYLLRGGSVVLNLTSILHRYK